MATWSSRNSQPFDASFVVMQCIDEEELFCMDGVVEWKASEFQIDSDIERAAGAETDGPVE